MGACLNKTPEPLPKQVNDEEIMAFMDELRMMAHKNVRKTF
jgi:hypothetical protein